MLLYPRRTRRDSEGGCVQHRHDDQHQEGGEGQADHDRPGIDRIAPAASSVSDAVFPGKPSTNRTLANNTAAATPAAMHL